MKFKPNKRQQKRAQGNLLLYLEENHCLNAQALSKRKGYGMPSNIIDNTNAGIYEKMSVADVHLPKLYRLSMYHQPSRHKTTSKKSQAMSV